MQRALVLALLLTPILAAQDGKALFRSNCAFCHGLSAAGGRGPSLISVRIAQNTTDSALKLIIHGGIPGTTMPAFEGIQDSDMEQLVAYLRSLAGSNTSAAKLPGEPAHGAKVYQSNGCRTCHRIGETGSNYGPELSRIGAARSSEYIRQSILEPSADIPPEYQGVTAVSKNGKRTTGARVNEDTFSLQLRLQNDTFAFFRKSDLASAAEEKLSLMPPYTKLPASDLQDLLAYLDTLRGAVAAQTDAAKAQGIK